MIALQLNQSIKITIEEMVDEIQIGMDKTFEILDKVDILSLYDIHKQI